MLKIISKFAMDILPSVVATIIGAYIVNHYIVTRPSAEAPVAAAVSPADPNKAQARADTRTDPRSPARSADAGNIPEPGVKAKGISEKAMLEQTAAERPTVVEKSAVAVEKPLDKSSEKPADKPAETASIPADPHRHPPVHDKPVAKSVAAPAVPAVAAAPVEASAPVPVEEHRDANELARAAIERLRGTGDASPRAQEAARVPDAPHVVAAPSVVAAAPPVRPLPPPITVSTPPAEPFDSSTGSVPPRTGYPAAALDDPRRPTPPADIPGVSPALPSLPAAGPLDLRAEVVEPQRREHTNVAEDMLLAAKSVFHAVLPK
jgi:hypothetical protein